MFRRNFFAHVQCVEKFYPLAVAGADNFHGIAAARFRRQQIKFAPIVAAQAINFRQALEHVDGHRVFKIAAAESTCRRLNLLESFAVRLNVFKKRAVEMKKQIAENRRAF